MTLCPDARFFNSPSEVTPTETVGIVGQQVEVEQGEDASRAAGTTGFYDSGVKQH